MLRRVFKAFHYRDFRLLWFGACTSSIGTFMQSVAQSWLVLDISMPVIFRPLRGLIISSFDRENVRTIEALKQFAEAHAQPASDG